MSKVKSRSVQLVKELYIKLEKIEKNKKEKTILENEANELRAELYREMENDGLESMVHKDLKFEKTDEIQFSLAGDLKGKKWDEVDVFFKFLQATGNEALIQTKTSVNAQTRNAFLRQYYEKNNKMPEFIDVSFFNTIKTRKA